MSRILSIHPYNPSTLRDKHNKDTSLTSSVLWLKLISNSYNSLRVRLELGLHFFACDSVRTLFWPCREQCPWSTEEKPSTLALCFSLQRVSFLLETQRKPFLQLGVIRWIWGLEMLSITALPRFCTLQAPYGQTSPPEKFVSFAVLSTSSSASKQEFWQIHPTAEGIEHQTITFIEAFWHLEHCIARQATVFNLAFLFYKVLIWSDDTIPEEEGEETDWTNS